MNAVRKSGRFAVGRLWIVLVASVGAIAMAAMNAAPAGAQDRTVPPERWVRQVCSGWAKYADVDLASFAAVDSVLGGLDSGELKPDKAKERLVQLQQKRVKGMDQVVRAVQRSREPSLENGAIIRQAYLDTVKEYRAVEAKQLAQYRVLAPATGDETRVAVQQAETQHVDSIYTIGYDPLDELKTSPVLAQAIDGASACNEVAQWLDLSGFSDVEVGQCMTLIGTATLESFRLGDTEDVDCAEPHMLEVYVQAQHPAALGEPYPGDAALQTFAEQECTGPFAGYVGRDYDSSSLEIYWYVPDEQNWKANDREILCLIGPAENAPLTGSARGSGL